MVEARSRVDQAEGLESLSSTNEAYVRLTGLIEVFASNVNKQFLGIAKQIKALDDKITVVDKVIQDMVVDIKHTKNDTCWVKAYLKKEQEEDEQEEEEEQKKKVVQEGSDSKESESDSEDDDK